MRKQIEFEKIKIDKITEYRDIDFSLAMIQSIPKDGYDQIIFKNCSFEFIIFEKNVNFYSCRFENCDFKNCKELPFEKCILVNSRIVDCNKVIMNNTHLNNTEISNCHIYASQRTYCFNNSYIKKSTIHSSGRLSDLVFTIKDSSIYNLDIKLREYDQLIVENGNIRGNININMFPSKKLILIKNSDMVTNITGSMNKIYIEYTNIENTEISNFSQLVLENNKIQDSKIDGATRLKNNFYKNSTINDEYISSKKD